MELRCHYCNGSGIDPKANIRWTSGGHDDRSCPICLGECVRYISEENWRLAEHAVARMEARKNENLQEWAERLAEDVAGATD